MIDIRIWPTWGSQVVWTLVTLAVCWTIGHVLGAVLISRLPRWLPDRQRTPAQSAIRASECARRLSWWRLLIGIWLAAGYWPLTPRAISRRSGGIGFRRPSVTLAVARIASRLSHRASLAPALPVSSLTRNTAWALYCRARAAGHSQRPGAFDHPMLTALGVGGLAVALALQEPLGNFFAGCSSRSPAKFEWGITSSWIRARKATSSISAGGPRGCGCSQEPGRGPQREARPGNRCQLSPAFAGPRGPRGGRYRLREQSAACRAGRHGGRAGGNGRRTGRGPRLSSRSSAITRSPTRASNSRSSSGRRIRRPVLNQA